MSNSKKLELKSVDQQFEFILNTPFSLVAIKNWLISGLNAIYAVRPDGTLGRPDDEYYIYDFKEIRVPHKTNLYSNDDADMSPFHIANCMFKIELFETSGWNGYMETTIQHLKVSKVRDYKEDNLIGFCVNIFKVVHKKTKSHTNIDETKWEKFFFKSIAFRNIFELNDSIFDKMDFKNPLATEYPKTVQTKAEYNIRLDSDFIRDLNMCLEIEKKENKDSGVYSKIYATYKGDVLDKKFPQNEQICLVEDAAKELLSRGNTLFEEIKIRLNINI